jgi:hypothetical protein
MPSRYDFRSQTMYGKLQGLGCLLSSAEQVRVPPKERQFWPRVAQLVGNGRQPSECQARWFQELNDDSPKTKARPKAKANAGAKPRGKKRKKVGVFTCSLSTGCVVTASPLRCAGGG